MDGKVYAHLVLLLWKGRWGIAAIRKWISMWAYRRRLWSGNRALLGGGFPSLPKYRKTWRGIHLHTSSRTSPIVHLCKYIRSCCPMPILIPIAIPLVACSSSYKQVFRLVEVGMPSYRWTPVWRGKYRCLSSCFRPLFTKCVLVASIWLFMASLLVTNLYTIGSNFAPKRWAGALKALGDILFEKVTHRPSGRIYLHPCK